MARQMLNEEYINRRAEDHNKWLAEADVAWRTKGIKLPYPPFAPYPSEEQILQRAQELLKFVVDKPAEDANPSTAVPPVVETPVALDKAALPEVPHAPPVTPPVPESGPLLTELDKLQKIAAREREFLYPKMPKAD